MMLGTNLTTSEIVSVEKVNFHLLKRSFPPKDHFGGMTYEGGGDEHQEPPPKARQTPLKRDGKSIQRSGLNELHNCKWELANLMDASILRHIDVPPPRIGCVSQPHFGISVRMKFTPPKVGS